MGVNAYYCKFCGRGHETHECTRYKTEESRKMIAKKKKMCHKCLVESPQNHLPEHKECPSNKTCLGWYSTEHHTVFCPARIEELKRFIFPPKIDGNLLTRFADTFEMDEKYVLATSSTMAQKFIPLKNIKVFDGLGDKCKKALKDSDSVFVITKHFWMNNNESKIFLQKQIMCKSSNVRLNENMKVAAEEILQIFSPITKKVTLENLNSEVTFSEIIEKVPNVEVFEIYNNSLKINDEKWVKDLLKFIKGKNLRKLHIYLDTVEFDIDALKEFITKKCSDNVVITIKYDSSLLEEEINNFVEKIGKHFFEEEYPSYRGKPFLKIRNARDYNCRYFALDTEPPAKKTRKRALQEK
uniref:DUF38 domain-containing protein n=1 Tax=Panagrolaimus sp. ES5 TaxID=591445 RepID=A0AC34FJN6_9BILA